MPRKKVTIKDKEITKDTRFPDKGELKIKMFNNEVSYVEYVRPNGQTMILASDLEVSISDEGRVGGEFRIQYVADLLWEEV